MSASCESPMKPLNSFLGEALLQVVLARTEAARRIGGRQSAIAPDVVTEPRLRHAAPAIEGGHPVTSRDEVVANPYSSAVDSPKREASGACRADVVTSSASGLSRVIVYAGSSGTPVEGGQRQESRIPQSRNVPDARSAPPVEHERRDFLAPLVRKKARPEQTEAAPRGDTWVDGITGRPVPLDVLKRGML